MSVISNAGMELMATNNPFGLSNSGRRTPFDSGTSEEELDFTTSTKGNGFRKKQRRNRKIQDKRIKDVAIQLNPEAMISQPDLGIGDEQSVTLVDPPSETSSSSSEEDDDAMSSVSTPSRRRKRRRRKKKKKPFGAKLQLNCFERYFFNTAPGLLEIVSRGSVADFSLNVVLRSVGQVTFCDVCTLSLSLSGQWILYVSYTHTHTYEHKCCTYRIRGVVHSCLLECSRETLTTCAVQCCTVCLQS